MSESEVEINKVVETFYFQRRSEGKVIPCSIECLADGSVYVNSEEFEILYEFAENAVERAIARVQSVGYEPVVSIQKIVSRELESDGTMPSQLLAGCVPRLQWIGR